MGFFKNNLIFNPKYALLVEWGREKVNYLYYCYLLKPTTSLFLLKTK